MPYILQAITRNTILTIAVMLTAVAVVGLTLSTGVRAQEAGSQFAAPPKVVGPPSVTLSQGDAEALPDAQPSYHIQADGTVDWHTYSGFRRYHDAGGYTQCHGPDGEGSTYGTPLTKSLATLSFDQFVDIVANGRTRPGSVMPPFNGNNNVMCYVTDIYIYLKARSDAALPRGRPRRHQPKPRTKQTERPGCSGL